MRNFNVRRHEFCYAGAWAYQLNLLTGELRPCYHSMRHQNIFEDPEAPLKRRPVGRSCGSLFCMNSSHFMSLGVIPELDTPTYADLRDRPKARWYTPRMRRFLDGKLADSNGQIGSADKVMATVLGRLENGYGKVRRLGGKVARRLGLKK